MISHILFDPVDTSPDHDPQQSTRLNKKSSSSSKRPYSDSDKFYSPVNLKKTGKECREFPEAVDVGDDVCEVLPERQANGNSQKFVAQSKSKVIFTLCLSLVQVFVLHHYLLKDVMNLIFSTLDLVFTLLHVLLLHHHFSPSLLRLFDVLVQKVIFLNHFVLAYLIIIFVQLAGAWSQ